MLDLADKLGGLKNQVQTLRPALLANATLGQKSRDKHSDTILPNVSLGPNLGTTSLILTCQSKTAEKIGTNT